MNEQTPACDALLGFCFEGPVRGLKENPGSFFKTQSLMNRLKILLSLSFNYILSHGNDLPMSANSMDISSRCIFEKIAF